MASSAVNVGQCHRIKQQQQQEEEGKRDYHHVAPAADATST